METQQDKFLKIYSDPELEKEFRIKAPLSELYAYHDWKISHEQKGKEPKLFECCGDVSSIYVAKGDIPNCKRCDKPMQEAQPKSTERGLLKFSVPAAYDKQGRPLKGKTVSVSRRTMNM